MRHTFLVVTVKKWLKLVYIYGSYRKIKTGVSLFGPLSIMLYAVATRALKTHNVITDKCKKIRSEYQPTIV